MIVCAFVICAETGAEAERLAASIDLRRLHMAVGLDTPVPTLAEAEAHRYTERERAYVLSQRERLVHGAPDEVRAKAAGARGALRGRRVDDPHDHRQLCEAAGARMSSSRSAFGLGG